MDPFANIFSSDEDRPRSLDHICRQNDILNDRNSNKSIGNPFDTLTRESTQLTITRSPSTTDNNNRPICLSSNHSSASTFTNHLQQEEEILEVTDYYLSHINETEYPYSNSTSTCQDLNCTYQSLSSTSTDLHFIHRDETSQRFPHQIHRTYDSSSETKSSALHHDNLYENIYDPPSSDSSDLDRIKTDQTYFWILHGFRKTYQTPSSSDNHFMEGDIETLLSNDKHQHTEILSTSLNSNSTDLEFVQRDQTFVPLPQLTRQTYSSSSSSEGTLVHAEITTLPTSDGYLSHNSMTESMENLGKVGVDTSNQNADINRNQRNGLKYGDDDLKSCTSSDFAIPRHCEDGPRVSIVPPTKCTSLERTLEIVDVQKMDSGYEAGNHKSTHPQSSMTQFNYANIHSPQESKVKVLGTVQEHIAEGGEDDNIDHLEGVVKSVNNLKEIGSCNACGKNVEQSAPLRNKWNVFKKARRILGKCFGRVRDLEQA